MMNIWFFSFNIVYVNWLKKLRIRLTEKIFRLCTVVLPLKYLIFWVNQLEWCINTNIYYIYNAFSLILSLLLLILAKIFQRKSLVTLKTGFLKNNPFDKILVGFIDSNLPARNNSQGRWFLWRLWWIF